MKLFLFLSHSGVASRRKAFEAVGVGRVQVNGKVVSEPSTEIDPSQDRVVFAGRLVEPAGFEYILLNKPCGYVTTCSGQFDQRTVLDLLPQELGHLRPVGRLDKDTEGLLFLTNDGALAQHLSHPRYNVNKTYYVRARGFLRPSAVSRLERGIVIEGKRTAPARVELIRASENESELRITIHEGRKRQVRLMMSAVGAPVLQLRRLIQGPLSLGNLRSGAWRRLTEAEIEALGSLCAPIRG